MLSNPLFSLTQMIDVQVFMTQSEIIQQLAVQPCVIVGRCADYVLRGQDILSVFINAPLDVYKRQEGNGIIKKVIIHVSYFRL